MIDFDFQDLIEDLFRLTGKKMSASDPLAIAAFFYSHQLRQASEVAARRIEGAAEGTQVAARGATDAAKEAAAAAVAVAAVCRTLEAERASLVLEFKEEHARSALELKEERARSDREAAARSKALADAFEARMKKAVRDVSRVQSTQEGPPQGWRGVLAGIAFGIVATAGAVGVACNFDFSWTKDAALGRMLKEVYPTLSASSKEELSRQAEKLYPR